MIGILARWVWRRLCRAAPYSWVWVDSYEGHSYCKRNILFPSLVITGKDIWNAKNEVRATKARWVERRVRLSALPFRLPKPRVRWAALTLHIPLVEVAR